MLWLTGTAGPGQADRPLVCRNVTGTEKRRCAVGPDRRAALVESELAAETVPAVGPSEEGSDGAGRGFCT